MDLSDFLHALRRWWLVIAMITAVSAGVAAGVTALQTPMYTATAQGIVSVGKPQERPPYAFASGAQYVLDRMTSYAELGVTTPVLGPVVDNLNLDETPLSLRKRVESHAVVGMAVLEVAVSDKDPGRAAAIANRTIIQMGRTISNLERGNVQMVPTGEAAVPAQPSNRKFPVNTGVAAAGGLVLGCLLAVCLQLLTSYRQQRRVSRA